MPKANRQIRIVSSIEYNQRARDARLQLERLEQSLVNHNDETGPRRFWLLRLLSRSVLGGGRRPEGNSPSPNGWSPFGIPVVPHSSETKPPHTRSVSATRSIDTSKKSASTAHAIISTTPPALDASASAMRADFAGSHLEHDDAAARRVRHTG